MTGNVLAKCYETKIGKLQKRAPKWYQNFFEKEKEKKSGDMVVNGIKIFLNMNNK